MARLAAYARLVWQSRSEVGWAVGRRILPTPPWFPNFCVNETRAMALGGGVSDIWVGLGAIAQLFRGPF